MLKLLCRQIHGHGQQVQAGLCPGLQLSDGRPQHPGVQVEDETAALGQRNECVRPPNAHRCIGRPAVNQAWDDLSSEYLEGFRIPKKLRHADE
ncbi:MAG: hypothetical protein K9L70_01890 [Thiohalocapsa sp.]|nr:hypothetical protein [Thiohalocapsa sp.]MCF7989309.1 hypothetical protein [Thiohalocapsa sp.]